MDDDILILIVLTLCVTNIISLTIEVKDLDNKVIMIQQNQEQIIQLIEANQ